MKPSSLLPLVAACVLAAAVPIASAGTTPEAAAAQAGVEAASEAAADAIGDERGAAQIEQRNDDLEAAREAEAAAAAQAKPEKPEIVRELAAEELPWLTPSVGAGPQE